MGSESEWSDVARLLAGECSPEEAESIRSLLAADPGTARLLALLNQLCEARGRPAGEWDVAAALERVHARLEALPRPAADVPLRRPWTRRLSRRMPWSLAARAAVVLLTLLGAGSAVWLVREKPGSPVGAEAMAFSTGRGQRATIRLADGSLVRLGPQSSLQVAPGYGRVARHLHLNGAGYFEVVADSSKPFLVSAGPSTTRVLGTRFGVQHYAAEGAELRVVVVEGRVALGVTAGPAGDWIEIGPSQGARLRADGGVPIVERVSPEVELAWLDGRVVFENTEFADVLDELERWYAVDFRVSDPTLARRHLTATYDIGTQSIGEILGLIVYALDATYEVSGGSVHFTPRSRS